VSFNHLLQQSDFIIVCAALTDSTKEIFDMKAFQQMKPNAIFINISRGNLVNQNDLVTVLRSKKIRGAGLDVMAEEPIRPNDPILKLDNCVLAPHNGSATQACRTRMAYLAVENVINCLEDKPVATPIILS